MEFEDSPWSKLALSPEMLKIIEEVGYKTPSPVQAQSIPEILAGNDVLVSSQTGSGKTASFVIPTVERFKGKNGTYILALSPTREIAQQTGAVFETFGAPFGLRTVVCIGGASIPVEKEALASSPHIIVATPGRLVDHLERGNVWLDFIQCLIFDEADRMLDMGFASQIEKISEQIPKERQTLMFSATFAPKVEKLARSTMNNPKEITIEKKEGSAPKIDQRLIWMDEGKKPRSLLRLIQDEPGTVIVFAKSKERVYQIWRNLNNDKFDSVTYIHSDIAQAQREEAIADFKAGKYRVLIATDVMGRGIDVDDVGHVVNYDVPREAEDYVHRIGRTGRRGRTGMATTFAIPGKDDRGIKEIEKLRGITEPTNRPRAEAPRADGPRPAGQRQDRPTGHRPKGPRTDRPRDDRPRDNRPREEQSRTSQTRPEHYKPRSKAQSQPQTAQKPSRPQAAPETKKSGVLGWIKKLFS